MGSKLLVSTKLRRQKVEMIKLLSIVIAVLTVTTFKAAAEEEVYGIVQKLDHFNYSDTRTIETSYVLNTEFYKSGGPLFVYTSDKFSYGNEVAPQIVIFDKLVKQHNGATLVYYNRDLEYSDENLRDIQYFTVEQYLADLSFLIRMCKKRHGMENAKVIMGGAHISGSIATWFKALYPDVVKGVWASSAPLVAKANFSEYYDFLAKTMRELGGPACYRHIRNGFAELESMLANNRTAEVKKMFNLCPSFDGSNDLDVSTFFSNIIFKLDLNIQQDILQILNICKVVKKHISDVSHLAKNFLGSYRNSELCIDGSYRSYLSRLKDKNELPMIYLQCNQLGWFRTTSANQPFGGKCPLSFFTTVCKDLFGDKYTVNSMENNIRKFNDFHGGSDLNLENVYFTYGEYDPWRAVGIHDDNMAKIIPSYENGDGFPLAGSDLPPELDEAQKKLSALVTEWLK